MIMIMIGQEGVRGSGGGRVSWVSVISVIRVAIIIIQIIKCAAVLRCPLLQHQSDAGH